MNKHKFLTLTISFFALSNPVFSVQASAMDKPLSERQLYQLTTSFKFVGFVGAVCKFFEEGYLSTKYARAHALAAWNVSKEKNLAAREIFEQIERENPKCSGILPDEYLMGGE